MKGVVRFFNDKKGYGFIKAENEKDYYVNENDVKGIVILEKGDPVLFEPEETDKGRKAKKVALNQAELSDSNGTAGNL